MSCKFIRCDNAGEHEGLKSLVKEFGADIEFTPPYSPQYNGRMERRFPVVLERGMAMMVDAGFNKEFRRLIWAEAMWSHRQARHSLRTLFLTLFY